MFALRNTLLLVHFRQLPVQQGHRKTKQLVRTMDTLDAPVPGRDHLERTSSNSRDDGIHPMRVKQINILSPTIREIILSSTETPVPFSFKAGQWVDVYIPNLETVGGFSMCSSPHEMTTFGQLRLAIKYSTHPPALWMHEKCKVGDELHIRVGGDFYLTCRDESKVNSTRLLLLIAGGVGINPLCSMVHYVMNEEKLLQSCRMCLLYSAKDTNELIFREAFDKYSSGRRDNFTVRYFLTQNDPSMPLMQKEVECRRICHSDVKSGINWLTNSFNYDKVEVFICGPPSMITNVTENLSSLDIGKVHFEKWW